MRSRGRRGRATSWLRSSLDWRAITRMRALAALVILPISWRLDRGVGDVLGWRDDDRRWLRRVDHDRWRRRWWLGRRRCRDWRCDRRRRGRLIVTAGRERDHGGPPQARRWQR